MAQPDLESENSNAEELQLTPQEERFLRRFIRRYSLGRAAAMVVTTAALVALGLGLVQILRTDPTPSTTASGPSYSVIKTLRSDVQDLRREIDDLEIPASTSETEVPDLASKLAGRIDSLARELELFQARLDSRPAPRPAPPVMGSTAEIAAIVERVYNLELRQGQEEETRVAVQRSVLDRLESLESRQERVEQQGVSFERDLLDRLYKLEVFRDGLEAKRLASERSLEARLLALETRLKRSTSPASPRP
ncbi:MAG: hypothetical protein ACE5EV_07600 [Gaiellales bacterium]